MAYDKMHLSVGTVRCANERRQYGALLMVSGIVAVIAPLGGIVTSMSTNGLPDAVRDPGSTECWSFVGLCCFFAIGVSSVVTGFAECVHDIGTTRVTFWTILLTQTAYIPFITEMAIIGQGARKDNSTPAFWNVIDVVPGLETSSEITGTDVRFIAAMGIFGVASYMFAFVGQIAFMQFSLYAFYNAVPEDRHSGYFAGRLSFYSLVLCVAGISQLMLGSYLLTNFDIDNGRLSGGYISVGIYTILYPSMSMAVGGLQVINGLWGFARSLDVAHGGPNDILYGWSMAFQWVVMLVVQVIVQIGYLPGGTMASSAPFLAAMSFSLNLMPTYLDYKMRNTLQDIPIDYYGCSDEYEQEHTGITLQ
ncbi:expressed unknown protein [Seminavis robusta]|uniref:Uncharacterized protein n=1 Tax=Seminavis robusta TaxID=568900 RepID=A0A9N8ED62_9STRA|nr:expressed unknown protein [Seminavis robusta]|eukprot:Sro950_g223760.1 n/a (363) ;mRNA; r:21234-22506